MNKMTPIMNEDFVKEFNKNKPSQEFFDTCKKARELIKIGDAKENGKCINYDTCPSCSGWCNNRQPSGECIEFILSAYDNIKDYSEKLCEESAELSREVDSLKYRLKFLKYIYDWNIKVGKVWEERHIKSEKENEQLKIQLKQSEEARIKQNDILFQEIEQLKINTSRDCRNCKYEEKLPTELPCRNCGYHNAEYFERKGETNE